MTTENNAVIKIIAKHTKEYNELLLEHNTLLEVHTKTVNDYFELKEKMRDYLDDNADIEAERYKIKKKNAQLVKIIVQWEKENGILQESLDACQRALEDKKDDLDDFIEGEGY